jgi:hypothetical protein
VSGLVGEARCGALWDLHISDRRLRASEFGYHSRSIQETGSRKNGRFHPLDNY